MDIEGNLFEHLLLERLNSEIGRKGGLSPNQFGFRKGRQAVHAANEVLCIANQALPQRELCRGNYRCEKQYIVATGTWKELKARGINESLIHIIAFHLSEQLSSKSTIT